MFITTPMVSSYQHMAKDAKRGQWENSLTPSTMVWELVVQSSLTVYPCVVCTPSLHRHVWSHVIFLLRDVLIELGAVRIPSSLFVAYSSCSCRALCLPREWFWSPSEGKTTDQAGRTLIWARNNLEYCQTTASSELDTTVQFPPSCSVYWETEGIWGRSRWEAQGRWHCTKAMCPSPPWVCLRLQDWTHRTLSIWIGMLFLR